MGVESVALDREIEFEDGLLGMNHSASRWAHTFARV
jgi:hypothetical protein